MSSRETGSQQLPSTARSNTSQKSAQSQLAQDNTKTQRHHVNHTRTRSDGNLPYLDLDLAQRCHADDVRGGGKTGNEERRSSGSSSGENVVSLKHEGRSQSAWNSRSGRRPHFSFSDLEAAGGDDNDGSRTSDGTRRKSTDSGSGSSGSVMTSVQLATPRKPTRPRVSLIPVMKDRLHPATINHVDDSPRRHSVNAIVRSNTTTSVLNLSRDQEED